MTRWRPPTTIRLAPPQIAGLDAHAKARGLTRSRLLREIVAAWLEVSGDPVPAQPSLEGLRDG